MLTLLFVGVCISQVATRQNEDGMSFSNFMGGVRYAHLIDSEHAKYYRSVKDDDHQMVIQGIVQFLKKYGFEAVTTGSIADAPVNYPSMCELTIVTPTWDKEDGLIIHLNLSFSSCRGDIIQVPCRRKIPLSHTMEISGDVERNLFRTLGYSKNEFHSANSLRMNATSTGYSESSLQQKFTQDGTDEIEGIYECMKTGNQENRYQIGIIKKEQGYQVIYLNGALNYRDWTPGEIKGSLYPTANASIFKSVLLKDTKKQEVTDYVNFKDGLMNFVATPDQPWVKVFPTNKAMKSGLASGKLTGTGFAVSSDGLIATAYHVIENRKNIVVRGINGDYATAYEAQLVAHDQENDLAILKINQVNLMHFDHHPVQIETGNLDLGSHIFVLSYPLTGSMGEDIKLTTGIINSRSGYQGDQTNYQVSASVHPGSSGGPVFNEKGKLIGMVTSKFQGAESVTYALKGQYLNQLLGNIGYQNPTPKIKNNDSATLSTVAGQFVPLVFIVESF
ncbi:MAG: serine protease [Flavobacteriales bacterium]|nr:serine protease [Flavobacteriales bacterium]